MVGRLATARPSSARAIAAFSLSLLGTFLVRSGVLTSVHAFASDPDRGVFILGFLLVVVGGSLLLYALRAPVVKSQIGFAWSSREALLLVNNVVLVVAALMVLLGTLYPLIMSAFDTLVSVGPPYFNGMFLPLMAILMAALGVGILSRWKQTPVSWLVGQLKWVLVLSAVGAVVIAVWLGAHQLAIGSLLLLVFWVCGASLRDVLHKTRNKGLVAGVRALPRCDLAHYNLGRLLRTDIAFEGGVIHEVSPALTAAPTLSPVALTRPVTALRLQPSAGPPRARHALRVPARLRLSYRLHLSVPTGSMAGHIARPRARRAANRPRGGGRQRREPGRA